MRGVINGVAFALVALGISAPAFADATTSPGTNSVHASTDAVAVPLNTETTLLTATIKKGKGHRVLMLDAKIASISPGQDGSMIPSVNGVGFEPVDEVGNGDVAWLRCPSESITGCTLADHWWLDLDAAEAAHPGQFIGQPLVITLKVNTHTVGGIGVRGAMSAQMVKK